MNRADHRRSESSVVAEHRVRQRRRSRWSSAVHRDMLHNETTIDKWQQDNNNESFLLPNWLNWRFPSVLSSSSLFLVIWQREISMWTDRPDLSFLHYEENSSLIDSCLIDRVSTCLLFHLEEYHPTGWAVALRHLPQALNENLRHWRLHLSSIDRDAA